MSDELINDPRPLLPQGRWFKVACAAVVLAGACLYLGFRAGNHRGPAAASSPTLAAASPAPTRSTHRSTLAAGLGLGDTPPASASRTLHTGDLTSTTIVVRSAKDGAFGYHSAVVTYPLDKPDELRSPSSDGISGKRVVGEVDVSLEGARASVRGDISHEDLKRIAEAVRIVAGRPAVDPVPGYVVVAGGPYRGCESLESRYGAADVGASSTLGDGLVYTVLSDCGSLEDALFYAGAARGPLIDGHASAISTELGGNATILWEISPTVIAAVGYSGAPVGSATIDALVSLARTARPLTRGEWVAARPQDVQSGLVP